MKYIEFINENLLNNFMDRREMVQIMLQKLDLKEKQLICKKLELTGFGKEIPEDHLSERDFFSIVSYYYLAKEKDTKFEKKFILYARDYLMTYKTFEDVLSYLQLKN